MSRCFILVFALYLVPIFSVILLVYFLNRSSSEIQYQEFMDELNEYVRKGKLPIEMTKRLQLYYQYKFQHKYYGSMLLSSLLSAELLQQIHSYRCSKLMSKVTLFQSLSPEEAKPLLNTLVHEVFLPNDVIIQAGHQGNAMYFLATGSVAVYSHSGKEICHLQEGAFFGETSLIIYGHKRNATIISIEICEVYRLDRKPFEEHLLQNTVLFEKIVEEAKIRLKQTSEIEENYKQMMFKKTYYHDGIE